MRKLEERNLLDAAHELLKACETFVEWMDRKEEGFHDSEHARDPKTGIRCYVAGSKEESDAFWKWYSDNVDLCDRAKRQALSAIYKAKGYKK